MYTSLRKKLILSTGLVMIALLIISATCIIKKRSSIYLDEGSRNYEYNFNHTNANISELSLKNKQVQLSKRNNTNQTVFLKVNINTTFMGNYFQPNIKMTMGERSLTQYFEYGAKGSRYLNISPLVSKGEEEIRLEGNHVLIDDQFVKLLVFKNQDIKKKKILIIAPHPDDAEIAAYGLYSSNKESYIVTVTAGDAGLNKYDEIYHNRAKQYLKKGKLRTWNSLTVPLLGGISIEHTINLGFFDGTLRTMYENKSSVVSGVYTNIEDITTFRRQNIASVSEGLHGKSDWNSLVDNLEYLLKEIKPNIIVTPYPALDTHIDHKFASIALFEAINKSDIKEGRLYFYTNHFVLNEHYPYGEEGGGVSVPPSLDTAIYFDSIYSHNLSVENQKDKLLALEVMNDLRLDTEWRSSKGAIKIAMSNIKRDFLGEDISFFRRAVRSNELFFVTDIKNIYNKEKLNRILGVGYDIKVIE